MKPPELALCRGLLWDIKLRARPAQHRVDYPLRNIQKPTGVADYQLTQALSRELASRLPSIGDLETEICEGLKEGNQ